MRKHLINLIHQLEMAVSEPLYDQKWFDNGHWDFVSYKTDAFLQCMKEAWQLLDEGKNLKFIDVGCGIGTKVHLASFYFDACGLELNQDYVKIARKINRPKKFLKFGRYKLLPKTDKIIKADALNFDYSSYDVIYFFRPMSNDKMQTQLEQTICQQMKPGSILIPIYAISKLDGVKNVPTPSGEIYAKKPKELIKKARQLF